MRRWGQIPDSHPDEWYFEMAKRIYRPDIYRAAAAELVKEGKFKASDFPPTDSDGFRPATKAFIDGREYDGRKPNDYIKSFEIGLK
jgi:nitrate/nitrite transport system substrate-binding protein